MSKEVVILRGIRGAGKTHWAKTNHPNAIICSIDRVLSGSGSFEPDRAKFGLAQESCIRDFMGAINQGNTLIIIDNPNITLWELSPYYYLSRAMGYDVKVVRFNVPARIAANRNIHGVSPGTVNQQAKQMEPAGKLFQEEVVNWSE